MMLEPGTSGYLNGAAKETYVGYDGQAFLESVKGRNTLTFRTKRGDCTARFSFDATAAMQDILDPVICA